MLKVRWVSFLLAGMACHAPSLLIQPWHIQEALLWPAAPPRVCLHFHDALAYCGVENADDVQQELRTNRLFHAVYNPHDEPYTVEFYEEPRVRLLYVGYVAGGTLRYSRLPHQIGHERLFRFRTPTRTIVARTRCANPVMDVTVRNLPTLPWFDDTRIEEWAKPEVTFTPADEFSPSLWAGLRPSPGIVPELGGAIPPLPESSSTSSPGGTGGTGGWNGLGGGLLAGAGSGIGLLPVGGGVATLTVAAAAPEPSSWCLFFLGIALFLIVWGKRQFEHHK